ncbi:MAG: macrolide ABC transporter ATP-binding protein [Anaerolineae bacterium SM23_84]|nr:MAG: macrolide ABC transporter ATP-binding protein [Anaerolineae bacterium SM23_84]
MAHQPLGETLIDMQGVSKIYRMGQVKVPALREVDLRIESGEITAIVGPSGSGKTTLLNLIGCLDLPTEGTYRLGGRDVRTIGDAALSRLRGKGIGFVFQDYSLLRRFDALRNVELPHYYATGHGNRQRALELLSRVGLADRVHHKPTQLSGGEQQRVALARGLMNEPFVLLADEPTGNLDTKSGDELMDLLVQLNAEQGLTVILVSHDPAISARARRVVHLLDGRVVEDKTQ